MRPLVLFGGVAVAAVAIAKGFADKDPDREFLQQAGRSGLGVLDAARLAVGRAASEPTRQFARQLLDEHERLNAELAVVAAGRRVDLPSRTSISDQAGLKMLAALDGESFDREFLGRIGVEMHRDSIELFEQAADHARKAEVRSYALRALPALREHLAAADVLLATVDAGGGAGPGAQT